MKRQQGQYLCEVWAGWCSAQPGGATSTGGGKVKDYQGIWEGLTTGAALYQPWGRVAAHCTSGSRGRIPYALSHRQEEDREEWGQVSAWGSR